MKNRDTPELKAVGDFAQTGICAAEHSLIAKSHASELKFSDACRNSTHFIVRRIETS
jgi:hypothetical protein